MCFHEWDKSFHTCLILCHFLESNSRLIFRRNSCFLYLLHESIKIVSFSKVVTSLTTGKQCLLCTRIIYQNELHIPSDQSLKIQTSKNWNTNVWVTGTSHLTPKLHWGEEWRQLRKWAISQVFLTDFCSSWGTPSTPIKSLISFKIHHNHMVFGGQFFGPYWTPTEF